MQCSDQYVRARYGFLITKVQTIPFMLFLVLFMYPRWFSIDSINDKIRDIILGINKIKQLSTTDIIINLLHGDKSKENTTDTNSFF